LTYFLIGGHECQVTNMYDCNGEETKDVEEAVTVVGRSLQCDGWLQDYLESCEPITVH